MGFLLGLLLASLNTSYLHAELRPLAFRPSAHLFAKHAPSLAKLRFLLPAHVVRGTAFYIGGGLVVSAGHIFSPAEADEPGTVDPEAIELRFGDEAGGPTARVQEVLAARYDGSPVTDYAILRLSPASWPAEESAFALLTEESEIPFRPLLLGFADGTSLRRITGPERGFSARQGKLVSFATTAPIEAGLSGGPILNRANGRVVGVNTAAVELVGGRGVGVIGTSAPFLLKKLRGLCAQALLPET